MSVTTESTDSPTAAETPSRGVTLIDPRAPRFGQTLTTIGLGSAVVFELPAVLFVWSALLVIPVLTRWQLDPYGSTWRTVVLPLVGPPAEREPASPHRFARVLGAVGASLASVLVIAGLSLPGFAIAAGVAAFAGLAAVTGICLGCRMYRQVAVFRRLDIV